MDQPAWSPVFFAVAQINAHGDGSKALFGLGQTSRSGAPAYRRLRAAQPRRLRLQRGNLPFTVRQPYGATLASAAKVNEEPATRPMTRLSMRACARVALASMALSASFVLAGCGAIGDLKDAISRWFDTEKFGREVFPDLL